MTNAADARELRRLIFDHTLEHTGDEWRELFSRVENVCAEIYGTTQQALSHPQLIHNGQVIEIMDPAVGKTKQVGPIALLAETPAQTTRPAPSLGQHTEEAVREWLASKPAAATAKNGTPLPRAPLEGITILELSSYVATPAGVALLAAWAQRRRPPQSGYRGSQEALPRGGVSIGAGELSCRVREPLARPVAIWSTRCSSSRISIVTWGMWVSRQSSSASEQIRTRMLLSGASR